MGPLTLNLLNPNDFSLCLLGTTSFDLGDFSLCFLDRLATGTRSRVKYKGLSLDKQLSICKFPTSNLELSIDGRWLEHLATAQKQLVIRKTTINIVTVDNLSGCYHIKPSSLVMGGLVCG